jgi:ferredoxin
MHVLPNLCGCMPGGCYRFYDHLPLYCDLCDGATSCVTACPSGALSYIEDHRDSSLVSFLQTDGNPNQKRANYVSVQGEPIREEWKDGLRVDS